MTITNVKNADTLELKLEGKLDTITAPQLEAELGKIADVKHLILNLDKLEYISSAGLRMVLSAQKKMSIQGDLRVINVSEPVMEVFEMTDFTNMMDISAK